MSGSPSKILVFWTSLAFVLLAFTASPSDAAGPHSAPEAQKSRDTTLVIPPAPPRQDEMSIRSETRLGTPQSLSGRTTP